MRSFSSPSTRWIASGGVSVAESRIVEWAERKTGASARAGSRQTRPSRIPPAWRSMTQVKSGPIIESTAVKRCSVKWKSMTGSSTSARRVSRFHAR